jgi:uridine kinase
MYIIGIAGGSGSGKTTFTHKVLNQVDDKRVGVLHQDSYYLACEILVVEGIFALWDENIRELMDFKCYLHVESDIRFIRRLFRDLKDRARTLEDIIRQYYDTVRPMHNLYLEPTQQYADIVVGEETDKAAYMLSSMIKQKLLELKKS